MDEPDHELLQRCRHGDEAALATIVARYRDRIYSLAWRMTGDAALAEEAAARTFVKIWSKSGQWKGQSSLGTWIYAIAYRCVLDVQRGQRRWWRRFFSPVPKQLASQDAAPDWQLEQAEEQNELGKQVQTALSTLSESDRALVHLYYLEERPLTEIAEILNVPAPTLKMRLARAREKLRKILTPSDTTNESRSK